MLRGGKVNVCSCWGRQDLGRVVVSVYEVIEGRVLWFGFVFDRGLGSRKG